MKEEIIQNLKDDHKQLMQVLYQLDQHLLSIKKQGFSVKNIEPLLNILDYIQVYPELWHHPTEDIIFSHLLDKLSKHDAEQATEVANIMEDHGVLEALTLNLQHLINKISIESNFLPVPKLSRMVHQYINVQLKHIEKEQNRIFPMVSAHFNDADWVQVKNQIDEKLKQEPYEPERNEYQSLMRLILSEHPVTAAGV